MEKKYNNAPRGEKRKSYSDDRRRDGKHYGRQNSDNRPRRFEGEKPSNIVVGRNAVTELIRSGAPVDNILVSGREGSVTVIIAEARKAGIPVVDSTSDSLDRLSHGENHQGVLAMVAEKHYSTVEEILEIAHERGEKPLIVVCDGIEDPHNLGAVIRCAECAGAHGVIIPERRACGLTPAVSKASAGAILHMAVAKVGNIAQTIEKLKENGVWTFAAEADGVDFYEADWNIPCAIVLGGEDSGVSRLVRERCDFTVSIPMFGKVNSLNVSTAASVLLCHAARKQKLG
ncbi:MAG: 23S rRNA (guanosine(2251)-2'-O)-methyltransferase RlmB [Clostridia bacterium]|nr:23S rRNA (guanosine(2251)-2'-O)-methyltransferase RlmB [Clostridia bacterium]